MAPYKVRPWPKRSWIPLGGWNTYMTPVGGPQPRKPEMPPNQIIRAGAPPPPPNLDVETGMRAPPGPPNRIVKAGPSWKDLVLTVGFSFALAGLIWSAIVYAGAEERVAEPRCVALSSVGPGVGFSKNRIVWGAWACVGDDGLWRWSHPASWDPVTVSESPPVEVKP